MFFRKNKYKVKLKGRSRVLYTEGKYKAHIDTEMMNGNTDLLIYFDLFCAWDAPFEDEIISDEDKKRIKKNIGKELENKGLIIEWN